MAYKHNKANAKTKEERAEELKAFLEKLSRAAKALYEFGLKVPLLGLALKALEKLTGVEYHKTMEDLKKDHAEIKQMAGDGYWLAGTNYQRIENMNERMSDVVSLINAMIAKETISEREMAVLSDKCKKLKEDIAKEKNMFRDKIQAIDETMDMGDGKWVVATLPGGQKAILDMEHCNDTTHGTTVLSVDPATGEFRPFKNLAELTAVLELENVPEIPPMIGRGGPNAFTIDERLKEGTTLTNIVDLAMDGKGPNWLVELTNSMVQSQNRVVEEMNAELKALESELDDKESEMLDAKKKAKEYAKEGAKKMGPFMTEADAKTFALLGMYHSYAVDCDIVPYPPKGKAEGLMIGKRGCDKGLYVHLDKDGHPKKISIIQDTNDFEKEINNGQYIWCTNKDVSGKFLGSQYESIKPLVQCLPPYIADDINKFDKQMQQEMKQVVDIPVTPVKQVQQNETEKYVQENIIPKVEAEEIPPINYYKSEEKGMSTITSSDGSGLLIGADKNGDTYICVTTPEMSNPDLWKDGLTPLSTAEGLKNNMIYMQGHMINEDLKVPSLEGFDLSDKGMHVSDSIAMLDTETGDKIGSVFKIDMSGYTVSTVPEMMVSISNLDIMQEINVEELGKAIDERTDKALKKEGLREIGGPVNDKNEQELE